jgi:hypothetical protein
MTTKCALACSEKLAKSIIGNLNGINDSLSIDYNFIFDNLEEVVDYIKTDENKLLDEFNMFVILDGAFNPLHTEKQKAFSFLLLQNSLNELGYKKLNLVLLTSNTVLHETVKELGTNLTPVCYMNTNVLLAKKIGVMLLSKVLLGDYKNTGLISAR